MAGGRSITTGSSEGRRVLALAPRTESVRQTEPESSAVSRSGTIATSFTTGEVQRVVQRLWRQGTFEARIDLADMPSSDDYAHLPWRKVDCMKTKLLHHHASGIGFGLDLFAPSGEERSSMHSHPHGDRIATVLEGCGTFFAVRNGELLRRLLLPGDQVCFPRGIPHAFWGGRLESLLVHVVLNPFVAFDDAEHTVPSEEGVSLMRRHRLIA